MPPSSWGLPNGPGTRPSSRLPAQPSASRRLICGRRLEVSVTLHQSLLHYAHQFMIQMADTALSNGRHKIEERLARWLLLADDRLDNHEIPLTHEFLGVMLGTARPGVTIALQELERRGWITHRRGAVTIIDRKGLVRSSNGAYLTPDDK